MNNELAFGDGYTQATAAQFTGRFSGDKNTLVQ